MKQVAYSKSAIKMLRSIPVDQSKLIRSKIEQYAAHPESLASNVIALRGSAYIRLRVGNWRVIMDDQGVVLDVLEIGSRGSIYK